MIQKRDIAISIILTIVTCGLYGIYWFIVMTDDVKAVAEDNNLASGGLAFVFSLLTCGIYSYYWAYKMGELLKNAQTNKGLNVKDNAILYIVLEIFGLGIVNFALIQNDLNEIANIGGAQ